MTNQQSVFIQDLIQRRSFGWIAYEDLLLQVLEPYNKKDINSLTHDEFQEIVSGPLFWDFSYMSPSDEENNNGAI